MPVVRIANLFLMFILLLFVPSLEAAELRGVILLNELGGDPVPNASVGAIQSVNVTATDGMGTFILKFPHNYPGDKIELVVKKSGYKVVNDIQLRLNLPTRPDSETLTLLLSKPEDLQKMAIKFYRLKGYEALEKSYKDRLAQLKSQYQSESKKYLEELDRAKQENSQAKAALERASLELARLNPEKLSETYQRAFTLFLKGDIDKALVTLDDQDLERITSVAIKAKADAERVIADTVQSYLLKADLLTTRFAFDAAAKAYEAAVALAPSSFDTIFRFATFELQLNHYSKASTLLHRAIKISDQSGDNLNRAKALSNLGIVLRFLDRQEEARTAYEDALAIYKNLGTSNSEADLLISGTLNNLGILYRDLGENDKALKVYQEALKVLQQSADGDPVALQSEAATLCNLGLLLHDQHETEKAQQAYLDSIKIYKYLAGSDPDEFLPEVLSVLDNLASLHQSENRLLEARKTYEEVIDLRRGLSSQNPDKFLPSLAGALHNLGVLHQKENRDGESVKLFEEALAIRRKLVSRSNEAYLPDLARTLHCLGSVYGRQKRFVEASGLLEEALDLTTNLAAKNPKAYSPDLAMTLINLGTLRLRESSLSEARKCYEDGLKIYQQLAQNNPRKYDTTIKDVLINLEVLRHYEENQQRRLSLEKAFKVCLPPDVDNDEFTENVE